MTLENTAKLHLRQGTVTDLIVSQNQIMGVERRDGRKFGARNVVVATGTFLNGRIHTGRRNYSAGRAGEPASIELAESLRRLGFPVGRLKTGTPPRLDGRTIDKEAVPFSFATDDIEQAQLNCYLGYTTKDVHQMIQRNLSSSPLYSGKIKGIGPRYCPSIEDKVVKFASKERHQLFLEPEGHDTNEVYLNGFSTSLPADLQQDLVRLIPGLADCKASGFRDSSTRVKLTVRPGTKKPHARDLLPGSMPPWPVRAGIALEFIGTRPISAY
jgi:tRNA uridine 5-carboxymethylaminomethyl modification enzyme